MKAKFLVLLALVLGVVSCQTEPEGLDVNVGGEIDAIVNVTIPEVETRAGGNDSALGVFDNGVLTGNATMRYILQVYYNGKPSQERLVKYSDGKSVAFDVRLVPGRQYTMVAWADVVNGEADVDNHYVTKDANGKSTLDNITLNGEWNAMDESRDAFTATSTGVFNSSNVTLDLKRPFAKLRVVTTDVEALENLGIVPAKAVATYTTPYRASFNAVAGTAAAAGTVTKTHTFDLAAYDDNTDEEMVLFTDYFFAESDIVKFDLDIKEADGTSIRLNSFNTDINVKRNYLTTIKGNILTGSTHFEVNIEDTFAGEYNYIQGDITLTEDLVINTPLFVRAGTSAVIDLNGHDIINNTKTLTYGEGEGIVAYGELTIKGEGTVKGSTRAVWARGNNGAVINIYGGNFEGCEDGYTGGGNSVIYASSGNVINIYGGTFKALAQDASSYADTQYPVLNVADNNGMINVYGGTFYGQNPAAPGTEPAAWNATHPNGFVAEGYKALAAGGIYYVLPETIANAAEAESVTAVTESTADVATALDTNNGKATLFMWNDVAYIAKYGEVVIVSDADEATTVRAVVEGATGLTSATVADGIEVVGNRTFRKCANLETVALPNTLTEIGPAVFQSCSKLANITIPESVTTIGEGAFAECTALTSINIPAGITRLEKDVLRNTGLVSVKIPASVNYIGTYAFRDCESLTEINILSPEFTIESNTFTNMSAPVPTMTIHVVNAEMEAYLNSVLSDYDKSYITVVGPKSVSNADSLQNELEAGAKNIFVAAGNYTFPTAGFTANTVLTCEEGTVFEGTSNLNINGATVVGATFQSGSNGLVANSSTINGTYKNCVFNGDLKFSKAGETIVFENCVFNGPDYALHFDTAVANSHVILKGCEVNSKWRVAIGAAVSMFEAIDTKFQVTGFINLWGKAKFTNCAFNKPSYWICCMDTTEFTNCTCEGRALVAGDIRIENTEITIDGVTY